MLGFLLLAGGGLAWADTAALTNAITSKETEIRWKKEDIEKAQRDVNAFSNFIAAYPASHVEITTADHELEQLNAQLAGIQNGNVTKMTIRMVIETYKAIKLGAEMGKAGVEKVISTGFSAGAVLTGYAAGGKEFVKDKMEDGAKALVGLDDETLMSPQTVRLKGVNAKARAAIPELQNVHGILAMSLAEVSDQVFEEEGERLGEVGSILRKNIMVRDAIALARTKLTEVDGEGATALQDAETKLPEAQVVLAELKDELAVLESALMQLKSQLATELAAEQYNADQALIQPPNHDLPPPTVNLDQQENETQEAYLARLQAARVAAVNARWAAESPGLITTISAKQTALQTVLDAVAAVRPQADPAWDFTEEFGKRPVYPAETIASISSCAAEMGRLDSLLDQAPGWETALTSIVGALQEACEAHSQLQNAHNRLSELMEMVGEITDQPTVDESVWAHPGTWTFDEADAGKYRTISDRMAAAKGNVTAARGQLQTALDTVSAATAAAHVDLDAELDAADSALNRLIAAGSQWQAALAAIPEASSLSTRYGVWTGPGNEIANFQNVVSRSFSQPAYNLALANLINAGDLEGARELRSRYLEFDTGSKSIQTVYEQAWQEFGEAWSILKTVAGTQGFTTLADWSAAGSSLPGLPGLPPADDARNARLARIANTAQNQGWDNSGGTWVSCYGLPGLGTIDASTMDDPDTMVCHRALDIRNRIEEGLTGWMAYSPTNFDAAYGALLQETFALRSEYYDLLYTEFRNVGYLQYSYLLAHENAIESAYPALSGVMAAYDTTHPKPVITDRSADVQAAVGPMEPFSTTLSVQATGDYLSYQWQKTQWIGAEYEYTWENIAGSTLNTLATPAVSSDWSVTWYYRCVVTNHAGSATSEAIQVTVSVTHPAPEFTSPASARATVGQPFTWQFTATQNPTWWSAHVFFESPIPGLEFDPATGTITGTPDQAGVFVFPVMAFSEGTPGTQEFTLTIEGGATGYDAWVARHFTPDQITAGTVTGALNTPANDRVANVLKFAMGIAPMDDASDGLPALGAETDGRLLFRFKVDKTAEAAVTFRIESSTQPGGPWMEYTPDAADVTDVPIGGERVERQVLLPKPVGRAVFYHLVVTLSGS